MEPSERSEVYRVMAGTSVDRYRISSAIGQRRQACLEPGKAEPVVNGQAPYSEGHGRSREDRVGAGQEEGLGFGHGMARQFDRP